MAETISTGIEDRPLSDDQRLWRWKVLISTYFAYTGFYFVRKVFPLCKTTLDKYYDISLDKSANIWEAYLVGYMVGQFINSFIGRKWGPRLLLLGGLGSSIAINVVFGFANSYPTFLSFMFFNGLVQAAGWPGAVGGIAEWLRRKERGTIMGVWSTNYMVGDVLVKGIAGYLLARYTLKYEDGHYGVRYAFLGLTILAFGIWWLVYYWQRNKPEDVGLDAIVDHEHPAARSIAASTKEQVGFREYSRLLLNPIVPLMGIAYFSIKFLRYALDSWMPTFLELQGMTQENSAYYSAIFNIAGVAGAVFAGFALDRIFRSRWEWVCLLMGLGIVGGYIAVLQVGSNPIVLAFCFGLVGFMLYGPDTLLCGAGAVTVAGQRNAVAVAGLVNGIASLGPVLQEPVNGHLLANNSAEVAVRNSNALGLSMSLLFVASMVVICVWVAIMRRRALAENLSDTE